MNHEMKPFPPRGPRFDGRGGVDKSGDRALQRMIAECAPKFRLFTYKDGETGAELRYYLYVPKTADNALYPLVQFIPDASVVHGEPERSLTQGWGGLIWADAEEQQKHPAFVVVPIFTGVAVDDSFSHSTEVDLLPGLLRALTEDYPIDPDRLYTTGQSMGGMISFFLNTVYPNLFAASLFVGSQWDNSILNVLEGRKFFYIVSAGDPKASVGQAGLMQVFNEDNAPYSRAAWSAKDSPEEQDAAVARMLTEGNGANFITFTKGTTLADGNDGNTPAGEHMTSFDYAYRIVAVRDWLMGQKKETAEVLR